MCILIDLGDFGDGLNMYRCDCCDTEFSVIWNRNPVYNTFEYCPFCGDEIEGIESEEEDEDE